LEDSANARQAIEMAVSSAFASKVDQVAIWGSGVAPEPKGVASYALESVELPSPLTDYTPITQARLKLLSANAPEPTAAIMSPALETEFGELTDTTGQPLRRPGIIEDVPFLQTMHAPAAGPVVVGHFPYLWLGMRTELRIEVLRELFAGTLEFGLLCHLRMDVALIHEDAFVLAAAAGA